MTTAPLNGNGHGLPGLPLRAAAARPQVLLGDRVVGAGQPVFVIAEIGINHNGDVELAKALVDVAADAGCDAVKFQKRTPRLCVPREQWLTERDTPWGRMTYLDYRERVELDAAAYEELVARCQQRSIMWFASCWDEESVEFIEHFAPVCHKVASASITDLPLLAAIRDTGRPILLSTGATTLEDIETAVEHIGEDQLLLAHTNSTYPCPPEQLNLRVLATLSARFSRCPIGYSGHEAGITPTLAAVALGATFVERHITLDKNMWGTDQSASLEPHELRQLVRDIREVELALGDGVKRFYSSELAAMRKLRRVASLHTE